MLGQYSGRMPGRLVRSASNRCSKLEQAGTPIGGNDVLIAALWVENWVNNPPGVSRLPIKTAVSR